MTASLSAISWGLNALSIWDNIPWSWIAFVTFIIFASIMFWRVYSLEKHVKILTDEDAQLERKRKQLEIETLQAQKDKLEYQKGLGYPDYLEGRNG